ncbi:hypothetical protein CEXT_230901 [Caerostris extrusa]|uniref:Uncharacterized protein n=1 Tax=Caerostris extrusa TaxID=172846 RepID=A0AAV4RK04_CAEEX|nr:hypothetical protein CEXT_230901 [Caerostris extrusa]
MSHVVWQGKIDGSRTLFRSLSISSRKVLLQLGNKKTSSNLNYDDNVTLLMKSDSDDPLMAFNLSLLKKEQSESEIIVIDIIAHRNVKHVNFESHIEDADGDKHLCGKEDFIFFVARERSEVLS